MKRIGLKTAAAALLGAGLLLGAQAKAEETLRAVAAFPKPVLFTQSFLRYVDKINEGGKGIVQIQFVGGPEVIKGLDQADAVRRGAIDMAYVPGSYYPGIVPETDALVGSNVTPMEQRANGGLDLFNKVHQEKLNAYYLGHVDGGIVFHVYTIEEPTVKADGTLDLSGKKLRGAPIYREFFTDYLGATYVQIRVPEVYTALERGTVDGLGWPIVALMDLKWDKLVNYRVDPGFFQTDLGVIVNLDKWKSLSKEAQDYLIKATIEYEKESYDFFQDLQKKDAAEMEKRGMKVVNLDGKAAEDYLAISAETAWKRLKSRDATHYEELRAKFLK
ncbi:MAG: TRAP transporter substrate-binding protein DctP [Minwuiales bacterium]|nr:TRAP transporter substrate-binding protein DctP [Minwuiales bacterium]